MPLTQKALNRMNSNIPDKTKETIAQALPKDNLMSTSQLLEAVSRKLEPLKDSRDEEEVPAYMSKAQFLPPKDSLRYQCSPSTEFDENVPDSHYPAEALKAMKIHSSFYQCDSKTTHGIASCSKSCFYCSSSINDTTNHKENALKSVDKGCICGDFCHCGIEKKGCTCGSNCGCGGMCGGNKSSCDLRDYVVVINKTCPKEEFMADEAEVGEFM